MKIGHVLRTTAAAWHGAWIVMVLTSFQIVSVTLSPCSHAEPAEQPALSFTLSFDCGGDRGHSIPPSEECKGRCLVGSFKPGLKVVLVDEEGICSAKTRELCTALYPYENGKATQLLNNGRCTLVDYTLAVIGAEIGSVRLVSQKLDRSPLPKHIESEARQLLTPGIRELCGLIPPDRVHEAIGDSPPRVFRAKNAAVIRFERTGKRLKAEYGPSVLLINNRVFRLCGSCTFRHFFFSVNDKLHLLCKHNYCCACGEQIFVVYDLSAETPAVVFEDSTFSD